MHEVLTPSLKAVHLRVMLICRCCDWVVSPICNLEQSFHLAVMAMTADMAHLERHCNASRKPISIDVVSSKEQAITLGEAALELCARFPTVGRRTASMALPIK